MFPPGFLGTRADLLLDIVICSLVVVVPILFYAVMAARKKNYKLHRNIQVGLTLVLVVVVGIFEWNLNQSGGIWEMTKESSFAGTWILNSSVYVHLAFAFSTTFVWLSLIASSLFKFSNPPSPSKFSRLHKIWGRLALFVMVMTGLTAVVLYVVGFAY